MHRSMMEGIRAARECQEDEDVRETKRLRLENLRLENLLMRQQLKPAKPAKPAEP